MYVCVFSQTYLRPCCVYLSRANAHAKSPSKKVVLFVYMLVLRAFPQVRAIATRCSVRSRERSSVWAVGPLRVPGFPPGLGVCWPSRWQCSGQSMGKPAFSSFSPKSSFSGPVFRIEQSNVLHFSFPLMFCSSVRSSRKWNCWVIECIHPPLW